MSEVSASRFLNPDRPPQIYDATGDPVGQYRDYDGRVIPAGAEANQ